ncbi:phosphoribosylglycinamide formyltransferase [Akkermansiaceae bacterium]|nr:phosphoribosylglycinamide formyltransferase [Akkermansiaceae bacterium]
MEKPIKLGVLGSGSGSNMQALIDEIESGKLNAEIVIALSDNKDAYILERASKAGIKTQWIDCLGFKNKFPHEVQAELAQTLLDAGVELVCLAGFMRLVKAPLLEKFPDRIINIHPSLLPNFPGMYAWKQAVDAGATESGCTVHYVDEGMDTGPIILQSKVAVLKEDTASSLHQKIQQQEYHIYPEAIRMIQSKR